MAAEESNYPNKGFVTHHMPPELLNGGLVDVYLCGPPPMVDAVRKHLADQGVQPASFYYEKFAGSGVVTEIGEIQHGVLQMASALEDLFAGQPMKETEGQMFRPPASTWADPKKAGGYGWGQLVHALGHRARVAVQGRPVRERLGEHRRNHEGAPRAPPQRGSSYR